MYKGARFFDGIVRVPLVIRWPERCAGGRRVDGLAELIDIAPTLLDAAGLEVPDAMQGGSLLPVLTGQAEDTDKDVVVSEFHDSCNFSEGTDDPTQAMMSFDGRYKMVTYRGHSLGELYDLENDPGEFEDLWAMAGRGDLKLAGSGASRRRYPCQAPDQLGSSGARPVIRLRWIRSMANLVEP